MTATTEQDQSVTAALVTDIHCTNALKTATGLRKSSPKQIPLSALFLSPDNVRTTKPNEQGLDELAALILAQGLLNRLQITAEFVEGIPTGRYGVEAGGRRYRALMLLLGNGSISVDELIDCTVIDTATATEVSLAENIGQEPMHPADEFLAFKKMIDQRQTIEAISGKFGVTVLQVQRRLKLANVAAEFMLMYREGEITLDVVMALASVDDHARQLLVWNSLPSYSRTAQGIKRRLCEEEVKDDDVRVKVVGLKNYVAAGGGIRADLFSDSGTQYLVDPGLLDMLFGEVLECKAQAVRGDGWSWVEVLPTFGYDERKQYVTMPPRYFPESAEIAAQRTTLESQIEDLECKIDADDDGEDSDKGGNLYEQIEQLEQQIEALKESCLDSAGVDKSLTGAVVYLSGEKITVVSGLVRAADLKKVRAQMPTAEGGTSTESTRPDVPERLMLNLSSHRTAAIQAMMLKNQRVTLASLACRMAYGVFATFQASMVKISLTQSRHALEKNAPTLAASAAAAVIDAEHAMWVERLPAEKGQWFEWLLLQPQDVVLSLLVFATANTVDAVQASAADSMKSADLAAKALGLDMADWWQPTPEAYLELVPKAKIIEAVTEAAGSVAAQPLLKMKKQEAVNHAAQQLQGKRWLPQVLRPALEDTAS